MVRRWRVALGGLLLICGGAAAGLYLWSDQPAVSRPAPVAVQAVSEPEDVQLTSRFFTAVAPGYLKLRTHTEQDRLPILERFILSSMQASEAQQLAITIAVLPTEGLTGVSDIRFRQQNEELYEPYKPQILPQGAVAFRSTDRQELSVFLPSGQRYAAVVLSGALRDSLDAEAQVTKVISSWQWAE